MLRALLYAAAAGIATICHIAAADDCTWTSSSGYKYDLTPLRREQKHSHYTYVTKHKTFKYYLNVCDIVHNAPYPCSNTEGFMRSPALQADLSKCHSIGSLKSVEWNMIDDDFPEKGVEITYGGGEACSDGVARMVKYHFICAPGFSAAEPPLLVAEKEGMDAITTSLGLQGMHAHHHGPDFSG